MTGPVLGTVIPSTRRAAPHLPDLPAPGTVERPARVIIGYGQARTDGPHVDGLPGWAHVAIVATIDPDRPRCLASVIRGTTCYTTADAATVEARAVADHLPDFFAALTTPGGTHHE